MKFSLKLVLCTTVVISVLFSAGGTIMVRQNFNHSLETAASQNNTQHSLERYAMESSMLNTIMNGEMLTNEKLAEYGKRLTGYMGEPGKQLCIYTEDCRTVFSNLRFTLSRKEAEHILSEGETYRYRREGDTVLMLFSSRLDVANHPAYLLSAYDVTSLFTERDRQLQEYLLLDALILVASVAAVALLSLLLTAPIKKLNLASRKIAAGAYHERTDIHTSDEIGELSLSFNQMAQAVEEKIDELGQSLQQRDNFIAGFSHEIKTPMTAIIGYADLLRSAQCSKEVQLKAANYIFREGKRLEQLSRKLMDLMALTDREVELVPLEADGFFRRLRDTLSPLLGGVTLTLRGGPGTFYGDPDLLQCLLKNLVENAVRSRPINDEVVLFWEFSNDRPSDNSRGRMAVQVSDTGRGIPPDELPHITEPFYMVDKSRTRDGGGAGIGLSLCRQIARLHGAELRFESLPDRGTTVSFELAMAEQEAAHEDI
ncbi:MAG: HAMP domain-containing histidine kinase [Clostridiales bacterium]|nr:HAMP domain-containing histidine kinase [Clostridiales bacterium]